MLDPARAREKPIKQLGRDGVRDKLDETHPWDKRDPCEVDTAFLIAQEIVWFDPFVPGKGGVCPWDNCPVRVVSKMLMRFVFLLFGLPNGPNHNP